MILALIKTLQSMNDAFGSGRIVDIRLHPDECSEDGIYGRAITSEGKEPFFRLENGVVTFLSRKRKLEWKYNPLNQKK